MNVVFPNARIAVLIATTGRASLSTTLETLARQQLPREQFLVCVVENGPAPSAASLVAAFRPFVNVLYRTSAVPGKTPALNSILPDISCPFIVFTDDDCRPDPSWLPNILKTFESHPEVSLVSGPVIDAHLPRDLHPSLRGLNRPDAQSFQGIQRPWEIARGANFAVRRSLFTDVGSFDPTFGPGSRIPAGEETEWILRVLEQGFTIRYEPSVRVTHDRATTRRSEMAAHEYYAGTGGLIAKHVLAGDWHVLGLLNPWTFLRGAGWNSLPNVLERLAIAVQSLPHLCVGVVRYLRLRW